MRIMGIRLELRVRVRVRVRVNPNPMSTYPDQNPTTNPNPKLNLNPNKALTVVTSEIEGGRIDFRDPSPTRINQEKETENEIARLRAIAVDLTAQVAAYRSAAPGTTPLSLEERYPVTTLAGMR
jgi:hypothetical protein